MPSQICSVTAAALQEMPSVGCAPEIAICPVVLEWCSGEFAIMMFQLDQCLIRADLELERIISFVAVYTKALPDGNHVPISGQTWLDCSV